MQTVFPNFELVGIPTTLGKYCGRDNSTSNVGLQAKNSSKKHFLTLCLAWRHCNALVKSIPVSNWPPSSYILAPGE